jgi:secreted PhoX family phosphatase
MSEITRRQLLTFLGAGAAAALSPAVDRFGLGIGIGRAEASGFGRFTPVRLPHPLRVYTQRKSFLPTGIDDGTILPPAKDPSLTTYAVVDDVVVPPEFERYVIVRWGDRVFPGQDDYVGYNHDYTAFFPLHGDDDGLLFVNHEYVSFPFSFLSPETPANLAGFPTSFEKVVGFPFPATKNREALGEMLYNCGGTVLHVRKSQGRYRVRQGDSYNRRVHGLSGLGLNVGRTDGYQAVTAWGSRPHQQGDQNYLIGTGPAARDVFPLSTDGLDEKIIGTAFNCSGATTPWGTVLSSEENYQGSSLFFVGVTEDVLPNGTQTGYLAGTTGAEFGQVGEKYGWIVEVDPTGKEPTKKHTALGRFRHENLALRAEEHRPLVAYMGDDRRGGHVWKFVSKGVVKHSGSKRTGELLESGTLFVARFNPDGTGVWIPLLLTTPTAPIPPSVLGSVEIANLGTAQRNGNTRLPRRDGVAGQTVDGGFFVVTTLNETTVLPDYQGKTLADFYPTQGAILVDVFLAANLVGGTPCARPEDFEVNPRNPREIFLAMTDGAPGSDGYPDSRIFVVAKYGTTATATQQSGSLHKLIENSKDGTGKTFRWTRFVQGGEAGAQDGTGFAAVDNLTFDKEGDLWGVTDISTGLHNGFDVGSVGAALSIDHALSGNTPNLVGVFGNNMLFCIPLNGPDAGELCPFAYGPPRCEMTGPTFVDGTLIISVQHPSEDSPIGDGTILSRSIERLKLDGRLFSQTRTVPRGSNWPDNITGDAANVPRPSTIGIRRKPDHR